MAHRSDESTNSLGWRLAGEVALGTIVLAPMVWLGVKTAADLSNTNQHLDSAPSSSQGHNFYGNDLGPDLFALGLETAIAADAVLVYRELRRRPVVV